MDVCILLAERWHLESNRFAVEDITMGSQSSGTDVFSLLTRRSAFLGWITCIQPFSGGLSKLPMKLAGLKLSIRSSSQMLPNGLSFLHSLFLVWLIKRIPSITSSFFHASQLVKIAVTARIVYVMIYFGCVSWCDIETLCHGSRFVDWVCVLSGSFCLDLSMFDEHICHIVQTSRRLYVTLFCDVYFFAELKYFWKY